MRGTKDNTEKKERREKEGKRWRDGGREVVEKESKEGGRKDKERERQS